MQSVTDRGQLVWVMRGVSGRVHHYKVVRRARVDRCVPPQWSVRVDLGFKGIVRDYPQRQASIPLRASKLHPSNSCSEAVQLGLGRQRMAVEHALACIKKYRLIGTLYCHSLAQYDEVMRTVCSLVNLRTQAPLEIV